MTATEQLAAADTWAAQLKQLCVATGDPAICLTATSMAERSCTSSIRATGLPARRETRVADSVIGAIGATNSIRARTGSAQFSDSTGALG